MLERIELFVAKRVLAKYMPTASLVHIWTATEGVRSYLALALWLAVYVGHRAGYGPLQDEAFTSQVEQMLLGIGAAALLEKFKRYLPVVDQSVDTVKEAIPAPAK